MSAQPFAPTQAQMLILSFCGSPKDVQRKAPHANQPTPPRPHFPRKGRWKLIHYVGFPPELFDIEADPEEAVNRAADPAFAQTLAEMQAALRAICDPEAVDAQAFADQDAMIESYGGPEIAASIGAPSSTPPPKH